MMSTLRLAKTSQILLSVVQVHQSASSLVAHGSNATMLTQIKKPKMGRCISGLSSLKRACKHYKHINFEEELPDMARSAVNLPTDKYFEHAMGHKFCLAAPGDFVSTCASVWHPMHATVPP